MQITVDFLDALDLGPHIRLWASAWALLALCRLAPHKPSRLRAGQDMSISPRQAADLHTSSLEIGMAARLPAVMPATCCGR